MLRKSVSNSTQLIAMNKLTKSSRTTGQRKSSSKQTMSHQAVFSHNRTLGLLDELCPLYGGGSHLGKRPAPR